MKPLLVSSVYFPPQTGGISQLMAGLAAALAPSAACCCLTGTPTGLQPGPSPAAPRVHRWPRAFAGTGMVRGAVQGGALCDILLRERPGSFRLPTPSTDSWAFISNAGSDNEILDARKSPWEKPHLALRRAARDLAVSRFTARLVEEVGVAAERIEIFHPGCDTELLRPLEPRFGLSPEASGG